MKDSTFTTIVDRRRPSNAALSAAIFLHSHLAHIYVAWRPTQIATWEANLASSNRRLLLRRVFERMDADCSGSVSLDEFRALMVSDDSGDDAAYAALFRWIEGAEGNADGELTSDEWVPFVLEQASQSIVHVPAPSTLAPPCQSLPADREYALCDLGLYTLSFLNLALLVCAGRAAVLAGGSSIRRGVPADDRSNA